MQKPKRVVWAYDRPHLEHPFILLGVKTLLEAGYRVAAVSGDKAPPEAPYESYDYFSLEIGRRFWDEVIKKRVGGATARRKEAHHARTKVEKERRTASRKRKWPWHDLPYLLRSHLLAALERLFELEARAYKKAGRIWRYLVENWLVHIKAFPRLLFLDADIFIASRPEAALLTALVAKLRRKRLVYFPFELYGEQIFKSSPVLAALERLILRFAIDALVTQNEMRAEIYRRERHARVEPQIVHNFKPVREKPPAGRLRDAVPALKQKRIVLYEGHITDGRWLDVLAQSAWHLPENVALVFLGPNMERWIQSHAAILDPLQAAGRLFILPPVPHDDLLYYVADADAGVIIYDDSVRNNYYCEPGKLSDYISAGVPIVASNCPTIGPLVRQHGIGLCFDGHDAEAIARTIMTLLEIPKSVWRPALARARKLLTWETQAPALLAAVAGNAEASRDANAASPTATQDAPAADPSRCVTRAGV